MGRSWSVVVPTLAGWQHLETTLPAMLAALGPSDEVVLVWDGREPDIPAIPDPRVSAVAHRGRRGFGPTCNAGARLARNPRLLLLNDDVAVCPDVLDRLGEALERPGVAAAAPNVWSLRLGRSESGTRLSWHHGVLESSQQELRGTGEVAQDYLCGAALAVQRGIYLEGGGFDEAMAPYYWEDVDLSLRLRRSGRLVVVADAVVEHRHGSTIEREPTRRRLRRYECNRLLVTWKNLSGVRWLSHLGWLPLRIAASVVRGTPVAEAHVLAVWTRLRQRSGRTG